MNEKPKMRTKDKVIWGFIVLFATIIIAFFVNGALYQGPDLKDPEFLKELIEKDQNRQRDIINTQ